MSRVKIVLEYNEDTTEISYNGATIGYWSFLPEDLENIKDKPSGIETSLDKLTKLRAMFSVDEMEKLRNMELL